MPFVPWIPPSAAALELRALMRRVAAVVEMRTQEHNRLHALTATTALPAVVRTEVRTHIRSLGRQIARLERAARTVVQAVPALQAQYERLRSIPGVGVRSALGLLAELAVLPANLTVRQWVAQAGLDPRPVALGQFGAPAGAHLQARQCAPAPRPLHAGAGGGPPQSGGAALGHAAHRPGQGAAPSAGRRDAQAVARHLRHASLTDRDFEVDLFAMVLDREREYLTDRRLSCGRPVLLPSVDRRTPASQACSREAAGYRCPHGNPSGRPSAAAACHTALSGSVDRPRGARCLVD